MNREYWGKLAFTALLGLVLSYAFVFLAVLPIRYLRLSFGRNAFLATSGLSIVALAGFGLWQWSLMYLVLSALVGFYCELEDRKVSIFLASAATIVATLMTTAGIFLGYSKLTGIQLMAMFQQKAAPLVAQLHQIPRFKDATAESILWYMPSSVIIALMVVLFISITVGRVPNSKSYNQKLRMFRLPDWTMWVFIASLAATFLPATASTVALVGMNVLAVTLAAYFFHGLAVFTVFLDRMSINGFWRMLAYFLVFFQMFIFVSGLGILDYWFNFRQPSKSYKQNLPIG